MLSMQLSNIPFYVLELERQKCVNLRNICPSRGLLDFQDSGRVFDKGRRNSGGLRLELKPPSELCLHTLIKL